MIKTVKKVLLILLALLLVGILILSAIIWYYAFDITGLPLYDGEPIKQVHLNNETWYFVTQDGDVYLHGGSQGDGFDTNSKNSRKCLNTTFHTDKYLNNISPSVLAFEGNAKEVIPYYYYKALIIDDDNTLHHLIEFKSYAMMENVIDAAASYAGDGPIYCVNNNYELYSIVDTELKLICSGITSVEVVVNRVFVTTNSNNLHELYIDDSLGEVTLSEVMFENVAKLGTAHSMGYRSDDFVPQYDPERGAQNPLFNVLTLDGKLYAKGLYNNSTVRAPMRNIEDWTLISEGVVDFAVNEEGTVMKLQNGGAKYYGFESSGFKNNYDETIEFSTRILVEEGVSDVFAYKDIIIVVTQEDVRIWGSCMHVPFGSYIDNHFVLSGPPHILEKTTN